MTSSPADVNLANPASPNKTDSVFNRRVFFILSVIALIYALFAGLRTVSDFDLGWQLATGRWVIQHHQVPSVDVFSYTAAGQPWIYPVGAGAIFYLAYLLGGYVLLSWLGAAACVATVALLVRKNSAVGAAIAVLAVPLIALRTTPRADMFSVVLFAAFLSLLWENHRTGRAPLWLLPLLMIAWVNLHVGFVAGLGLVAAYVVAEALEAAVNTAGRSAALTRLRRAGKWLGLTALVTLANPWGWGIYRAILLQQRVAAQHEYLIAEWVKVPVNWIAITSSLSPRQTQSTIYVLLAIAVVAAALALWRAQLGAALLLLGAIYVGVRYVRMGAVFACVVVVAGGPVLFDAAKQLAGRIQQARARSTIAWAVVALFAVLTTMRCYDLATNRFYFQSATESTFGAGPSWWFPERAAEFIQKQNLPGEIFNSYNEGGYLSWRLGPERRDSIDGRAIPFGVAAIERNGKLLQSSPDSPLWQEEASRYNINTILLPLGRYDGIQFVKLLEFCNSTLWQPVYLDEISAVFVRRTPQTEELRQRFPVNCAEATLPQPPPGSSRVDGFNAWTNAAGILAALGRNSEALTATENALAIFPDSAFVHWLRANILFGMRRLDDSEQEYAQAVALDPSEVTWSSLAEMYQLRRRTPEAIDALQHAAALAPKPHSTLVKLGYFYLNLQQPGDALKAFNDAARSAPANVRAADNGTFDFMLAQGRSAAWTQLGDLGKAVTYQEQAAQIEPDAPEPWRRLAKLYQREGRMQDAEQAEERAAAAEAKRGR
ncbi:MAG: hypothetical protein WA655_07155 [Candidatus Korobacteraceae bacterium]